MTQKSSARYVMRRGDATRFPIPATPELLKDPAFVEINLKGEILAVTSDDPDAELRELRDEIDRLRSNPGNLRAEALEGQIALLRDSNTSLTEQLAEARRRIGELENALADRVRQVNQLEAAFREAGGDVPEKPFSEAAIPELPPAEQYEQLAAEIEALFAKASGPEGKKQVEEWTKDRFGFDLDLRANMDKLKQKVLDLARESVGLPAEG